jgi:homocysteine S-methyltransferase
MSTLTTSHDLPQLSAPVHIADGGLETSLIFLDGIDLPDFAAFPLVDTDAGRAALRRYYEPYLDIAAEHGVGIVLDTPTWRASADWGHRLGYDRSTLAAVNERAVELVREFAGTRPDVAAVVNGAIGPRGDGYVVGSTMSVDEATSYHSLQTRAFARAGADLATAVTMTYVEEAIGIARAAITADLPVAIGFTTELDGRLPSGTPLREAVETVDAATDGQVAYFMINCAHATHFESALADGGTWLGRIKAIRSNASKMSHAELDDAEELDRGDLDELRGDYHRLRALLPDLRVIGGCCGTDHEHIAHLAEGWS